MSQRTYGGHTLADLKRLDAQTQYMSVRYSEGCVRDLIAAAERVEELELEYSLSRQCTATAEHDTASITCALVNQQELNVRLEKERDQLRADLERERKAHAEVVYDVEQLRAELADAKEAIRIHSANVDKLRAELETANKEIAQYIAGVNKLRAELESANEKLKCYDPYFKELDKLRAENERLRAIVVKVSKETIFIDDCDDGGFGSQQRAEPSPLALEARRALEGK